jgi:hypothetical protein
LIWIQYANLEKKEEDKKRKEVNEIKIEKGLGGNLPAQVRRRPMAHPAKIPKG